MENASDALIMAGQVLIFLVALTVCISSYTTLRVQIDRIIGQTETVSLAKDSTGYINFIESKSSGSIRKVGADTIVSTISRAPKENYVVYIKLLDNKYNYVGSDVVVSKATKDITINGQKIISKDDKIIKVTNGYDTNQNVNSLLKNSFYNVLKDGHFFEYLGEYQDESAEGVSTENKQVKRLITYIESND